LKASKGNEGVEGLRGHTDTLTESPMRALVASFLSCAEKGQGLSSGSSARERAYRSALAHFYTNEVISTNRGVVTAALEHGIFIGEALHGSDFQVFGHRQERGRPRTQRDRCRPQIARRAA
jgi:hypothetical protein